MKDIPLVTNYYHRDADGDWFIKDGEHLHPIDYSGSMEIAYQQGYQEGVMDTTKRVFASIITPSIHLRMAEWSIQECEKALQICHDLLTELEKRLKEQPKPSEVLG